MAFLTSMSGLVAATAVTAANASGPRPELVTFAIPPRSAVSAIRISHLSDDLMSDVAIDPANFAGHAGIRSRTIAAPATVSAALEALRASAPRRADVYPDCRWELTLLNVRGVPVYVAYADRFVLNGSIGAYGVTFAHAGPLHAFLHAHDPLR